jgi:hypothetical protein
MKPAGAAAFAFSSALLPLEACSGGAAAPAQAPPPVRPAIEGYIPSVQMGNVTRLGDARVPFARYLNAMHEHIHPIFMDDLSRWASSLPKYAPSADLQVGLEMVIAKDTGRIVRMGVFRPSRVTTFDLLALATVGRAAPFGPAPDVIASPDGNVYVHWDFHSDPTLACIPINARPYILQRAPSLP